MRGVDRTWLRSLYGFAISPHIVFYLKADVDTVIRRVLQSGGMDFWESGMDMKLGDDIYESFRTYQAKLLREYNALGEEFGFRTLDARQSIDKIQNDFFAGELALSTRLALLNYLKAGTFNATRVKETIALALSTSEFQWY